MANTIAHLAVAKQVLQYTNLHIAYEEAYYLGAIAPDTISSKENAVREDKKLVHLRHGIADADWLLPEYMKIFDERIAAFIQTYIVSEKEQAQRDFNIGYLVHLLTDKYNHKTIRQSMLKAARVKGISEYDKSFFYMMVNDLGALDWYILERDKEIAALFKRIWTKPVRYALPDMIEKEYIEKSIVYWKEQYIPSIRILHTEVFTPEAIEDFIYNSAKKIGKELDEGIGHEYLFGTSWRNGLE